MQGQVILAVWLSFVSTIAFAQQDRVAPGGPSEVRPVAPTMSHQPWQRCLHQLCGQELGRIDREVNEQYEADQDRLAQDYGQLINATIEAATAELNEAKLNLENLVQAMRQDREITSARALQFNEIISSIEYLDRVIFNSDRSVDVVATRRALADQSPEKVSITLKAAQIIAEENNNLPDVVKESLAVLKQRLTDEQIRQRIMQAVEDVERNEQMLAEHYNLPRESVFPGVARWQDYKKRLTSSQFDAYDLEQLSDRYSSPAFFAHLIREFKLETPRRPVKARSLIEPELLKAYEAELSSIQEYLSGRGPKNNLGQEVVKVAAGCLMGAVTVKRYFPTAETIEAFKPIERRWRDDFIGNLKSHLSGETMGKVEPFFAGLRIDPPKTKEQWLKDVVRDLHRIKTEANVDWMANSDEARQLGVITMLLKSGRSAKSKYKPMEKTEELCNEKGDPVADESDINGDRVGVGALTIHRPTSGRPVSFHEYGHTLSGYLLRGKNISSKSKEKFNRWRDCLTKAKGGDTRFLEEDFADLLAFNFAKTRIDIFCGRLNDQDPDQFTLSQTNSEDTHSSRLFRLLHGEVIFGKVPDVCRDALAAKGEKFEMKNCLSDP